MRLISRDMTLQPGDIILCGIPVWGLDETGQYRVGIAGVAKLGNRFEQDGSTRGEGA